MDPALNNEPQNTDISRKRSIDLFTYLRELTKLRSKVVRTLEGYDEVVWLSDVPREQECFTPAWGAVRADNENVWLEVKKPHMRPYPPLPKELEPWVREAELTNTADIPNLLPRILAPESERDKSSNDEEIELPEGQSPRFLELDDHPHLLKPWEKYLDDKWLPWAEEHVRIKKVQEVYAKLHSIYQRQKRQGETYELVLGIGLLTWKTPSGQEVRRHLLAAQSSVELDGRNGTLSIVPGAEGARVLLEQDMLETSERPSPDEQILIEEQVKKIGDNIWNVANIDKVIKEWIYEVSGEYSQELKSPNGFSSNPIVTYAPAIILRERSARNLITTFDDIIQQLESGGKIPTGVRRIVKISEDNEDIVNAPDISDKSDDYQDILFPLPSNDEQMRIIANLRHRQGVLVQGPPGTGKSHTIVNLICHLLATGKRVLITSQTARALKVLKGKIPGEMSALCVNILGNDLSSLQGLEDSVHGITNQHQNWNPEQNKANVVSLENELDSLRRREAELRRRVCEIRERETYEHRICSGTYSGTAQCIAERISSERLRHEWLLDICIEKDTPPPLSNVEALELLDLHRKLSVDQVAEAKMSFVLPEEISSHEKFVLLRQAEINAQARYDNYADVRDTEIYKELTSITNEQIITLNKAFTQLLYTCTNLLKKREPWVAKAVQNIISGNDGGWRELFNISQEYLKGLMGHAKVAEEHHIDMPKGCDSAAVKNNANALLSHFEQGGGIGIPLFRPRQVKEAWYLIKKTRVDGQPCKDTEALKRLLSTLEVDETLDRLWSYWAPYTDRVEGSRPIQTGILEDLCKTLEEVLELYSLLLQTRDLCAKIGLLQPAWHVIEEVERYQHTIEGVESEKNLMEMQAMFNDTERKLSKCMEQPNVHPVVNQVHQAIIDRDEKSYRNTLKKLDNLVETRSFFDRKKELHDRLTALAPVVAKRLESEPGMPYWDQRIADFTGAWQWAQANTWLDGYIANSNEDGIETELKDVHNKIGNTTNRLAAVKAWGHCIKRIGENERQHLMAWTHEMKKIGLGKTKRAEIHRKAARKHMEQCRSAIPAWIMPLYRVAETVKVGVDAYDVVIIDEASQSGADAMFLQFLAKKIIVVGDDEQISPENIGVPRQDVDLLQDRYLKDLPPAHKSAMGVESSFFDFANIIFPGRIILREHFRCMPEIIRFSNDLCYTHTPLMPLRQYPSNRLEPVITYHVADGYRKGDSRTVHNSPEAEAIVKKIVECCKKPDYDCPVSDERPHGKRTMGVISLLGKYQTRQIERMLLEELGPEEIKRRDIVCGDAYAFQGDERDIMFLSMVAAPGETTMKAVTSQADKRRFNVAASRARDQMWLFHTPTVNDFRNKKCLRYRLLSYCQNPVQQQLSNGLDIEQLRNDARTVKRNRDNHPTPFDSWFEVDVFLKIVVRGFRAIPQFKVAGYSIDIVIEGMHGKFAIECDGDEFHSTPEQISSDERRERILGRCGWAFWRVRGSEFYRNQDGAMGSLWAKLEKLGIATGGKDIKSDDSATMERNEPLDEQDNYMNVSEEPEQNNHKENKPEERQLQLFIEDVEQNTHQKNKNDRLQHAFEWCRQRKRHNNESTSGEIKQAIVSVLKDCPNMSCTKKSLATKVLKQLHVITRGSYRLEFEKRVIRALNKLKKKQVVEEYKATNVRIRLLGCGVLATIS